MRKFRIGSARPHRPGNSWSFNFTKTEDLQHRGDWRALTTRMVDAARCLEAGGAGVLLSCTNTMHHMVADVQVAGKVLPASRDAYSAIIACLIESGAEVVILGCTEIMLPVRPEDSEVPILDTTALHAAAAIEMVSG